MKLHFINFMQKFCYACSAAAAAAAGAEGQGQGELGEQRCASILYKIAFHILLVHK